MSFYQSNLFLNIENAENLYDKKFPIFSDVIRFKLSKNNLSFVKNNKYNFFRIELGFFNSAKEERINNKFLKILIERSVDFLLIKKLNSFYFILHKNNNVFLKKQNSLNIFIEGNYISVKKLYFKIFISKIKKLFYKLTNLDVENLNYFTKKNILNFCITKLKFSQNIIKSNFLNFSFSFVFQKFYLDYIIFNYSKFFFFNIIDFFFKKIFFLKKNYTNNLNDNFFFKKRFFLFYFFNQYISFKDVETINYKKFVLNTFYKNNVFENDNVHRFTSFINFQNEEVNFFFEKKINIFLSKINVIENLNFFFFVNNFKNINIFFEKYNRQTFFLNNKSNFFFKYIQQKNQFIFYVSNKKQLDLNNKKYNINIKNNYFNFFKKKYINFFFKSKINDFFKEINKIENFLYNNPNFFFSFDIFKFFNNEIKIEKINLFSKFRKMFLFYYLKKNKNILLENLNIQKINLKTYYKKFFFQEKCKDLYLVLLKKKKFIKNQNFFLFENFKFFFDSFFKTNFKIKMNLKEKNKFNKKIDLYNFVLKFFKNFSYFLFLDNRDEYIKYSYMLINILYFLTNNKKNNRFFFTKNDLLSIKDTKFTNFLFNSNNNFSKHNLFLKNFIFQNKISLSQLLSLYKNDYFKNKTKKIFIKKYFNKKINFLKFKYNFIITQINCRSIFLSKCKQLSTFSLKNINNKNFNYLSFLIKFFLLKQNFIFNNFKIPNFNLHNNKYLFNRKNLFNDIIFSLKIKIIKLFNFNIFNKIVKVKKIYFYFFLNSNNFLLKYLNNIINLKYFKSHNNIIFKNKFTNISHFFYKNLFISLKNKFNFNVLNFDNLEFLLFFDIYKTKNSKLLSDVLIKKTRVHFKFLQNLIMVYLNFIFFKNQFSFKNIRFNFFKPNVEKFINIFCKNKIHLNKKIFILFFKINIYVQKSLSSFYIFVNSFLKFLYLKTFFFSKFIFLYKKVTLTFLKFLNERVFKYKNLNTLSLKVFSFFFHLAKKTYKKKNLIWLHINETKRNVFVNLFLNRKKPSIFVFSTGQTLFEGRLRKSKEAGMFVGRKLWKRIVFLSKKKFVFNNVLFKNFKTIYNVLKFKNKIILSDKVFNNLNSLKSYFKNLKKFILIKIEQKKKIFYFLKKNKLHFFKEDVKVKSFKINKLKYFFNFVKYISNSSKNLIINQNKTKIYLKNFKINNKIIFFFNDFFFTNKFKFFKLKNLVHKILRQKNFISRSNIRRWFYKKGFLKKPKFKKKNFDRIWIINKRKSLRITKVIRTKRFFKKYTFIQKLYKYKRVFKKHRRFEMYIKKNNLIKFLNKNKNCFKKIKNKHIILLNKNTIFLKPNFTKFNFNKISKIKIINYFYYLKLKIKRFILRKFLLIKNIFSLKKKKFYLIKKKLSKKQNYKKKKTYYRRKNNIFNVLFSFQKYKMLRFNIKENLIFLKTKIVTNRFLNFILNTKNVSIINRLNLFYKLNFKNKMIKYCQKFKIYLFNLNFNFFSKFKNLFIFRKNFYFKINQFLKISVNRFCLKIKIFNIWIFNFLKKNRFKKKYLKGKLFISQQIKTMKNCMNILFKVLTKINYIFYKKLFPKLIKKKDLSLFKISNSRLFLFNYSLQMLKNLKYNHKFFLHNFRKVNSKLQQYLNFKNTKLFYYKRRKLLYRKRKLFYKKRKLFYKKYKVFYKKYKGLLSSFFDKLRPLYRLVSKYLKSRFLYRFLLLRQKPLFKEKNLNFTKFINLVHLLKYFLKIIKMRVLNFVNYSYVYKSFRFFNIFYKNKNKTKLFYKHKPKFSIKNIKKTKIFIKKSKSKRKLFNNFQKLLNDKLINFYKKQKLFKIFLWKNFTIKIYKQLFKYSLFYFIKFNYFKKFSKKLNFNLFFIKNKSKFIKQNKKKFIKKKISTIFNNNEIKKIFKKTLLSKNQQKYLKKIYYKKKLKKLVLLNKFFSNILNYIIFFKNYNLVFLKKLNYLIKFIRFNFCFSKIRKFNKKFLIKSFFKFFINKSINNNNVNLKNKISKFLLLLKLKNLFKKFFFNFNNRIRFIISTKNLIFTIKDKINKKTIKLLNVKFFYFLKKIKKLKFIKYCLNINNILNNYFIFFNNFTFNKMNKILYVKKHSFFNFKIKIKKFYFFFKLLNLKNCKKKNFNYKILFYYKNFLKSKQFFFFNFLKNLKFRPSLHFQKKKRTVHYLLVNQKIFLFNFGIKNKIGRDKKFLNYKFFMKYNLMFYVFQFYKYLLIKTNNKLKKTKFIQLAEKKKLNDLLSKQIIQNLIFTKKFRNLTIIKFFLRKKSKFLQLKKFNFNLLKKENNKQNILKYKKINYKYNHIEQNNLINKFTTLIVRKFSCNLMISLFFLNKLKKIIFTNIYLLKKNLRSYLNIFTLKKKDRHIFRRWRKYYSNFDNKYFVPKRGFLLILAKRKNRVIRGIYKGFLHEARGRKMFKRLKPRFIRLKRFIFTRSRKVKGRRK